MLMRIVHSGQMPADTGVMVPADEATRLELRARNVHYGDILEAEFHKPNDPGFNRRWHKIGQLLAENAPGFEFLSAHDALKRAQALSGVCCEFQTVPLSRVWEAASAKLLQQLGEEMAPLLLKIGAAVAEAPVEVQTPRSLSFDSIEGGERREAFRRLCEWIAAEVWPGMTPDAVEQMVQVFPD